MNEVEREALGRAIGRVIEERVSPLVGRIDSLDARCDALGERMSDVHDDAETVAREMAAGLLSGVVTAERQAHAEIVRDLQSRTIDALDRLANVPDPEPGEPGRRGEPGPEGSLAQVKTWAAGEIYRAGDFVWLPKAHPLGWAMAEATAETFDIPGDEGAAWEPRLYHGAQGRAGDGMRFAGVHQLGALYAVGDVVKGDAGAAWVRTSAGISEGIPGDAWSLLVKQGKTGGRGKQGPRGVGIADIAIDGDQLVITLDDGSVRTLPLPIIVVREPKR